MQVGAGGWRQRKGTYARTAVAHEGRLAWALPVMTMLSSLAGVAWLTLAPQPDRPLLAIFPPWWDRARAVEAVIGADGRLVGLGAWPGMLVAAAPAPGLPERLRAAGAWLLLDARNAAGCVTVVRRGA